MSPRKIHKKDAYSLKNTRLNIVSIFFILLLLTIELRLFQIQVLSHSRYQSIANEQYWDNETLPPQRGQILTSDGYILAGNQIHYLLYAEPKKIKEPQKLAQELSIFFASEKVKEKAKESSETVNAADYYSSYYDGYYKLLNRDLLWVPLQHYVTPTQKDAILQMNLEGFGFENEPIRYYPEGTLASHILGFVASDEKGEKVGYYGIEGSLNNDLKGKPGKIMEESDATGTPILIGSYKKIEPIEGRDIVLTIKRPIQYIVEKKLKEGVEKYDAISGSIIVMDPFTGEILAMANYPTYHPSNFSTDEKPQGDDMRRKPFERVNVGISNTYEPGSVMKPFTISTAIDLNLVKPETTYEDNGPVQYSGKYIDNWDGKHYGVLSIIGLLQKSNNIGAAWVGHLVGNKKLYDYFKKFGFGSRTNIDLEGEDSGILRDYRDWLDIDLAVVSFGQGISATPLQVLNGFNAIINGGYLLEPKIISKIVDKDKEITIPTKNLHRVISQKTSDTMIDLLEKAAEGGEAKYFTLKDYRVGGKTGTAQIPEGGGYSKDRTNATFVGFLVGSKKFTMIVRLEEPKTSIYAAETAVPVWMGTAEELIKYYGLAPDRFSPSE